MNNQTRFFVILYPNACYINIHLKDGKYLAVGEFLLGEKNVNRPSDVYVSRHFRTVLRNCAEAHNLSKRYK